MEIGQFAIWVDMLGIGNKLKDPYATQPPIKGIQRMVHAKNDIKTFQWWVEELFPHFPEFNGCAFSDGLSVMSPRLDDSIFFTRLLFRGCFCRNIWLRAGISVGNNFEAQPFGESKKANNLLLYGIVSDAHYHAYIAEQKGPKGMKIFLASPLVNCITNRTYHIPRGIPNKEVKMIVDGEQVKGSEICWTSNLLKKEREISEKFNEDINIMRDTAVFRDCTKDFLKKNAKWREEPSRPIHHILGTIDSFEGWKNSKSKK